MKRFIKSLKTAVSALIILIYVSLIGVLIAQALTPGEESAAISDSFGDKINQAVTDIKQPMAEKIGVTAVEISSVLFGAEELSGDEITLTVGGRGSIIARALPDNASNKSLVYTADDNGVLSVYPDGRMIGKAEGETTVTVSSAENPALTATVKVNVISIPLESMEMIAPEAEIRVGDVIRAELEFYPEKSREREVIWQSSDGSVIEVDERGMIKALSEGEATVYATSAKNSEITASMGIIVLPALDVPVVSPTSITVTSGVSEYKVGTIAELSAELYPADAEGNVIWLTSDESVATVTRGGILKCHSAGNVTVIAMCGGVESKIDITVKESVSENIYLSFDGISILGEGYVIKQGEAGKIIATLDEGVSVLDITFASSNEFVAKISPDGGIEARHGGRTKITVSTSSGEDVTSVSFILTVERLTLEDTIDNFYTWVRKAMGHFGAFLVLGIFGSLTYYIIFKKSLRGKLLAFLTCIFAGFAVAGITEILQLPIFTLGRGPSFSDVMLDFTGYCTSTVPIFLFIIIIHLVLHIVKKVKKPGCNES